MRKDRQVSALMDCPLYGETDSKQINKAISAGDKSCKVDVTVMGNDVR